MDEKEKEKKEKMIRAITLILDEHSDWFGRIMRKSFYPGESRSVPASPPSGAGNLMEELRDNGVHERMVDIILSISKEMYQAADNLIEAGSASEGRPDISLMDNLINLSESFLAHIRRLEKDNILAGSGIDTLTGLRTSEAMFRDLELEMERRARRGKPFCVVLARIDGFGEFSHGISHEHLEEIISSVADIVRKCVRTYDDAYYIDNGEFVLCLKHADIRGGMAAVNRLRRMLKEAGGQTTLSYVTAEPGEGDDVKQLIVYLRDDIDQYVSEKDVSLQYYEVSPLKRYLRNMKNET